MPRFPGCDADTLSDAGKKKCSEQELLRFIYKNITYPDSAIANNTEGSVVVRFVVRKDGSVADATVIKDIGHGCGAEAKRVVELMNEQDIVLGSPGQQMGQPVEVYFNLPVKFKLESDLPDPDYVVNRLRHRLHQIPQPSLLPRRLRSARRFSAKGNDPTPPNGSTGCKVGVMDFEVLIRYNGQAVRPGIVQLCQPPRRLPLRSHPPHRPHKRQLAGGHPYRQPPCRTIYPHADPHLPLPTAAAPRRKNSSTAPYNWGRKPPPSTMMIITTRPSPKWTEAIAAFPESVASACLVASPILRTTILSPPCPRSPSCKGQCWGAVGSTICCR